MHAVSGLPFARERAVIRTREERPGATHKLAHLAASSPRRIQVPPPLLFDALHAALSAPSVPRGLLRLWALLAVRTVQGALVAARLLGWPRRLYGAAA